MGCTKEGKHVRVELRRRRPAVTVMGVFAGLSLLAAVGCGSRTSTTSLAQTEQVARRNLSVTVEATGTVEPINLVEVKSKASGQIVEMPVEIGTAVGRGDLLVQVDPRDVQNEFDQAEATLSAAEARSEVARLQKQRADQLFAEQVITATEHEAAMLDDANAKAELVRARTNLDLARQRLEDATVRAPIAGTVLEKPVSVGQVISSATSSVSGGTTLLKMADLGRVRMRAMVVETDIGQVKEGQSVNVVVDAYPQRVFNGTVEKIEPQAVVDQSVTMFPVLISITNEEGLLLPGMNGEVTMLVSERRNALTVPVDAVRTMRELPGIANVLGFDADSLRNQMRGRLAGRGGGGGADADAQPAASGRDSLQRRSGRGPNGAAPDSAQRAMWRQRRAAGGGAPGGGRGSAGGGGGGGARSMPQFAVVKNGEDLSPRIVRLGISDYDYVEVLGGLEEGEEVLLLGVVQMEQERAELQNRIRSRVGGGVTQQNDSNQNRRSGGQ